jgi:hypothetical protein
MDIFVDASLHGLGGPLAHLLIGLHCPRNPGGVSSLLCRSSLYSCTVGRSLSDPICRFMFLFFILAGVPIPLCTPSLVIFGCSRWLCIAICSSVTSPAGVTGSPIYFLSGTPNRIPHPCLRLSCLLRPFGVRCHPCVYTWTLPFSYPLWVLVFSYLTFFYLFFLSICRFPSTAPAFPSRGSVTLVYGLPALHSGLSAPGLHYLGSVLYLLQGPFSSYILFLLSFIHFLSLQSLSNFHQVLFPLLFT